MPKRLLFLVPARLGDAIMLTPALALLKRLQPEADIGILAATDLSASVYENNPACDAIHINRQIRPDELATRYDMLVAAHRDYVILDMADRLPKPLVLIEPNDKQQSRPQQALNFIQKMFSANVEDAPVIGYELFPDEEDARSINLFLDKNAHYVGFHLGCHGINKGRRFSLLGRKKEHKRLWPLQNFVELAQLIKREHAACRLVITGGANEQHLAARFMKQIPDAINLVGKTSTLQLAAAISRFSVYVTSDTGALHVACAMNVPLVALFLPMYLKQSAPYPAAGFRRVLQAENVADISPLAVFADLNAALAGHSKPSSLF